MLKEVADGIEDNAAALAAGDPDPVKAMSPSHRAFITACSAVGRDQNALPGLPQKSPRKAQAQIQETVNSISKRTRSSCS